MYSSWSAPGASQRNPLLCASTLRGRLQRAWSLSCPGVGLERGAGRRGGCLCREAEAVNSSLETRLSVFLGECQPKCPFCLSTASSTPWHLSLCILSTSSTSSWTLLCWAHAVSSGFRSHWVLALPRLGFPVTLWHFSTWSYTVFCVGIIHPKNRLSSWRYHIFSVSFYTPSVAQDYTCSSCSEILNTLI